MRFGWKHLWLLLTVAFVAWGIWGTFRAPSRSYATGSSAACLPGTYAEHVEQEPSGLRYPTQPEIEREARFLAYWTDVSDGDQLRTAAETKLTRPTYRSVTYFSCSTYWYLIKRVLMGLLWSVLVAMAFFMARWMTSGSRKDI